jgi:hypothetical protein
VSIWRGFPSSVHKEEIEAQRVWVCYIVLGLSPFAPAGPLLLGKVLLRFTHAVTLEAMYMVDFGGVIASHAVAVRSCETVGTDSVGPSSIGDVDHLTLALVEFAAAVDIDVGRFPQPRDSASDDEEVGEGIVMSFNLLEYLDDDESALEESDDASVDEEDPDWAAAYQDFCGDSNFNSDWEVPKEQGEEIPDQMEEVDFDSLSFEHQFCDANWEEPSTTLMGNKNNFSGLELGPTWRELWKVIPLHELWVGFWPADVLEKIYKESNRYAGQPSFKDPTKTNANGKWIELTPLELKVWIGICIYMGIKCQPNMKLYWKKLKFFGCESISCCDAMW